jgi:hypothetical protein
MSALNWQHLRHWGGSQHNAFEELCCQLAAAEQPAAGAKYRRIGAPDAGVECVWEVPDGPVYGWQAKFFLSPPTAAEWGQIDESVYQAVDHYPNLAKYTICLPIDRPDARLSGQKSMMKKWEERVDKWTKYAARLGSKMEFDYWGEHEIVERLGRAEHAGRMYFWFGDYTLSAKWFRDIFDVARANAGERYSPELHVNLEISTVFDALARHPRYLNRLKRQWGIVRREVQRSVPAKNLAFSGLDPSSGPDRHLEARVAAWKAVESTVDDTLSRKKAASSGMAALSVSVRDAMPFAALQAALEALLGALNALQSAMDKGDAAADEVLTRRSVSTGKTNTERALMPSAPTSSAANQSGHTSSRSLFESERYHLRKARRAIDALLAMCCDESASVANSAPLLIHGPAGTGKTHLFCDVVDRAISDGEPCVLVLGEQIVRGDPWPQIFRQLQLDCQTPSELLGALSAAAEAAGRRAVLLIDALNEGEGRDVWLRQLPGFLATIAKYPWVAVAISVRSSYLDVVVSDTAQRALTAVGHVGFAEQELDATRRFFDEFGIERPSIPLLTPEFANPLFLKLFCRGLKNRGLTRVPLGLEGISAVFDFFLSSVNDRLAALLDFDVHESVVSRSVSALATEMLETRAQWVTRERARELTESVFQARGWEQSLLRHLLSESVLSEEMVWDASSETRIPAIRFTYERLGDHRVAALLLDDHLKPRKRSQTTPKVRSTSRGRTQTRSKQASLSLSEILNDERSAWRYQGILSALAIQVPERTGRELWELRAHPHLVAAGKSRGRGTAQKSVPLPIAEAFLDSLEWRRPDSIGPTALDIVDRHLRLPTPEGGRIRDLVVSAAARPEHPLNADYLDAKLASDTMAERDGWWSTFIAEHSEMSAPMRRLIDWAWRAGGEAQHADEAVMLASVALAWALTTSNREVRDHATKGLVSLLHKRPKLLRGLLKRFRQVNDLYVTERLYAVAYGCTLLGIQGADLEAVARDIYAEVFASGSPPAHLLLRDYARGVIELAASEGLLAAEELHRARPPYNTSPPGPAPSEEELNARYNASASDSQKNGYRTLQFSLGAAGDFARYIVGTNSNSFDWSSRPLYGPHATTKRERHEVFFEQLPASLRSRWNNLIARAYQLRSPALRAQLLGIGENQGRSLSDVDIEAVIEKAQQDFRRLLPRKLRAEFDQVRSWSNAPAEEELFDLKYALRWLFQRVIDLGWTPERFGSFDDRRYGYEGRMSHRSERIGKKYQWIAWEEFTARVSDNFAFRDGDWRGRVGVYHGPWQLYGRDIDPSYLGRGGHGLGASSRRAWWQRVKYPDGDWRRLVDDKEWIASPKDLPRLSEIVQTSNPKDSTNWWWLDGDVFWREPEQPDEEPYERARRSIHYWISTFLVRTKDRDRLLRWANRRDLWDERLHETSNLRQVFLGEHPWAPAFRTQYATNSEVGWTRLNGRLPVPVLRTAVSYHWESSGYDQSIDETLNVSLPAKALLRRPRQGAPRQWPQPRTKALYLNPSLSEGGPDALLARAVEFRKWLDGHELDVVWLMTGEKLIVGDQFRSGRDVWPGRLEISAVACFRDGKWWDSHVGYINGGKGTREPITW